ncbi:sulfate transporter, partial [Trifolium medium]|nr:sulfate transporter [Trifolium medium]
QKKDGQQDPKRRKAGGVFRHSLYSLKKVARLPCKDRSEVLRVLKKNVHRRRGETGVNRSCSVSHQPSSDVSSSSASVNNDSKHWVVMQGNDQVAVDDVWGIWKAIGVKFKGDNVNMFSVFARVGKVKQAASGQAQGGMCMMKIVSWNIKGLGGYRRGRRGNSPHAFSYRPSVGASG